jgi:hypothetical protein
MASCVGDDHSQQRAQQQSLGGDDSQGVPITFTYTALQVDTAATRSAASATLSDAVIEANQAVTVRVSQHGQSQFSSYTFTSASGGVLTPPQQAPTYPINGAAVDIRAFTPSSAATGTFTVQQHQETDAGYIASDLMWTKVDNQTSSSSPVPLTFVHKMAKVRVTAHAGTAISSINQIRLLNVKPTVTFDYDGASGALGAATGSTTVYLFTEGTGNTATGVACIPPQTFTNTNLLAVDVTLADGTSTGTVYYRVDSKVFAGSKLYSLDVTVSRLQVGTTITISGWTDSNPVNTTSGGEFTIADIPAQTYSVSGSTPAVTVSYQGTVLTSSQYDAYYYSNTAVGTAYVGVLGKGQYAGVHGVKAFTINKANSSMSNGSGAVSFSSSTGINSTISRTISCNGCSVSGYTTSGSGFSVSRDGNTLTVTRTSAGAFSGTITVTGSGDSNHNAPSSITIGVSGEDTYPFTSVTSSDVGKVLCSNGHVHNTVSDVTCGGVASGIICYVGDHGSVDDSNSTYKGLAIALANCGSYIKWCSQYSANCLASDYLTSDVATAITMKNGINATYHLVNKTLSGTSGHTHAAANAANNFSTARPSGASGWFLPSMGQWNLIVKGLTGSSTNLSTSSNSTYQASNVNTKITAAGGTGLHSSYYRSSTEYSAFSAWFVSFNYGLAGSSIKDDSSLYARAVFAF